MAKTIRVVHRTKTNPNTGLSKLVVEGRPSIEQVVAHYEHGAVQTTSGDVWDIAPDPTGKADFISVFPN